MRKHFLILMLLALLPFTAWADDLSQGKIVIASTYVGYAPTCDNTADSDIKVYNKVNTRLTLGTDFTFDGFFSDPQCNNSLTGDQVKALDALTTVYVKVTGINYYEKSLINTFELKKMPLRVMHANAALATKVFGQNDPTTLFTVYSVKEKAGVGADRTALFNNKISFSRVANENAGSYDFIATITDDDLAASYSIANEDIVQYTTTTTYTQAKFVITPKDFTDTGLTPTVTATVSANLTYNGNKQKATVQVKDIAFDEILTERVYYADTDPEVIAGTKTTADIKVDGDYVLAWANNQNAGTNTASVTITGCRNYATTALTVQNFSIKKAPLLVTPSATKVYDGYAGLKIGYTDTNTDGDQDEGEPDILMDVDYTYQGFVDASTAADVTVGGSKCTVTGANKKKGVYKLNITTNSFTLANYEFLPVEGQFEITQKEITFTAANKTFSYGDAETFALTDAWKTDVPAGNKANDESDLPKIIKIERAQTKIGGSGLHKDDYLLTPRFLTDSEINALSGYNAAKKTALIDLKNNYDADFVDGYATIGKASLKIALKESAYGKLEKVYDGQPVSVTLDKTNGLTIIGKKSDTDVINLDNLELTVVNNSANVNTYQLVLDGATAENYDITYIPSQYKITKRPLTLTVHDQIFVKGTVPTLNADLYTIEDTEAKVEGLAAGDAGKVFKLQLDGTTLNIAAADPKIIQVGAGTYEAIKVVNVGGLDSRFANYDIFVNNDVAEYAPATYYTAAEADAYNATIGGHVSAGDVQTPAVYTQIPVSTALVDGTTYYTAADGSTSIVYEDGTSAANNGTNYWEKTSNAVLYTDDTAAAYNATLLGAVHEGDVKDAAVQHWGRAIVKAASALAILTIDDTKNIKADLITAATPATPATPVAPVNITFSNRTLKAGVWYTLVLPFDITVSNFSKAFGYAVVDMFDQTASDGKVHFNLYMGNIPANTPFMFKIDGEKLNLNQVYIENQTIIYDPEATEPREGVLFDEIGNPYVTDGSDNKLVGFYGKKAADITAPEEGDNMLAPGEYYLNGSGVWTPAGSNGATIGGERAKLVLATNAREILVEEPDGSTTAIACINAEGVAVEANGWYTLDGIKLQGAPTEKGVYIRNGKKMVIK